jgi:aspartate/methionine/tyrosine aminotransferase
LSLIEKKLARENLITAGITPGAAAGAGYRVIVTAGANMGFVNAICAITDPGDEVILLLPYYFNQEMAIRMLDCTPIAVATDERFQPRPGPIEHAITEKTRALVTISPNNPSGAVYPEPILRAINALCRARGLYHISDEAYEHFTYGGARHFSPGSIPEACEHTISLFSLSKAYGFASWRIGYMDPGYQSHLRPRDLPACGRGRVGDRRGLLPRTAAGHRPGAAYRPGRAGRARIAM